MAMIFMKAVVIMIKWSISCLNFWYWMGSAGDYGGYNKWPEKFDFMPSITQDSLRVFFDYFYFLGRAFVVSRKHLLNSPFVNWPSTHCVGSSLKEENIESFCSLDFRYQYSTPLLQSHLTLKRKIQALLAICQENKFSMWLQQYKKANIWNGLQS